MTAAFDFGALPPEINSGRLYFGPGSTPMHSAAAAWNELAIGLRSQADSYGSAIYGLTSQGWRGPASMAMAAAVTPYLVWMNATAAQAEQTANQAVAAASAFETAFAMTVPPPVIAANRTQLATLIATNAFGQNAPAIATTEAQYSAMWAQDATAMYGYAGQSAAATKMASFTTPPKTTSSSAPGGQAAAVAQAAGTSSTTETQAALTNVMSSVPRSLHNMAAPATGTSSSSSGSDLASILDPNSNFWNTLTSSGAFNPAQIVTACTASTLGTAGSSSIGLEGSLDAIAPLTSGFSAGAQGLSGLGGAGTSVSAGMGQAALIGHMSVPPAWTATAPPAAPLSSALGTTPIASSSQLAAAGFPGVAPTALGQRAGLVAALPDSRFLERPPMVPRWSYTG